MAGGRAALPRHPRALHIEAALKLVKHLVEAALYRVGALGAQDAAHVMLLLSYRSLAKGIDQAASFKLIPNEVGQRRAVKRLTSPLPVSRFSRPSTRYPSASQQARAAPASAAVRP